MKKIVFTGGGTLGHVMPNKYLMDMLNGWSVFYIGSNGIEKEFISSYVNTFYEIPTVKFARGKFFVNLKIPFRLIRAIRSARKILKMINPDVVFSNGGYVSLPVAIASRSLKIPIVAHENDSSFGLANRIILRLCKVMCVNFEHLEEKNSKIKYTGPIFSKDFESKKIDKFGINLEEGKPTLLIIGGSLGSAKINTVIMSILKDILKDFNVIHITGKGNKTLGSYANYNAFELRKDMCNIYNLSDFVLGRAGAGVCAEAFYKRLPMLLIPLENGSSRGDQVLNAGYYEKLKVARILRESDLTPTNLLQALSELKKSYSKIKENYAKLKQINGREQIIKIIEKIGKNTQ